MPRERGEGMAASNHATIVVYMRHRRWLGALLRRAARLGLIRPDTACRLYERAVASSVRRQMHTGTTSGGPNTTLTLRS